uniref:Uncharacterized protein n=1 Tax=Caenorhabditis japonica TaxID=281687 RepID=A0A8R1INT1_CAEJA
MPENKLPIPCKPLRKEDERILWTYIYHLTLLCMSKLKLNSSRQLVSWTRIPKRCAVALSHSSSFEISWRLELKMWKHILDNSDGLSAKRVRSLGFWRTMGKINGYDKSVSGTKLVNYFTHKLCPTLFARKLPHTVKMSLIRDLGIILSTDQLMYLFRVDGILMDLDDNGYVTDWRLWNETTDYEPIEPYSPWKLKLNDTVTDESLPPLAKKGQNLRRSIRLMDRSKEPVSRKKMAPRRIIESFQITENTIPDIVLTSDGKILRPRRISISRARIQKRII